MLIQVGYGLEGALPDITAFDITRDASNRSFARTIMKAAFRLESISYLKQFAGNTKEVEKPMRETGSSQQ